MNAAECDGEEVVAQVGRPHGSLGEVIEPQCKAEANGGKGPVLGVADIQPELWRTAQTGDSLHLLT